MNWITHGLRGELSSPWLEIVLAFAAIACGGIVGTERERHDKPAGLRTLILVCLGSAVFTMVSFAFTTTTGDSGRIAAQIVTGIGFLGAGAILHSRTSVSGMTTAATIWMIAAVGITVGAGLLAAGLGLSLLVRLILVGIRGWEIRHLGGMKLLPIEIVFDGDHGKARIRLEQMLEEFHVSGPIINYSDAGDGCTRARLDLLLPRRQLHEFLSAVVELAAVREIRELHPDSDRPTRTGATGPAS